jgi:hypothetical protein
MYFSVALLNKKSGIVYPLPVWVYPSYVIIHGGYVFKDLFTGRAAILGNHMQVSNVALENVPLRESFSTSQADEASGTFLHLGLH